MLKNPRWETCVVLALTSLLAGCGSRVSTPAVTEATDSIAKTDQLQHVTASKVDVESTRTNGAVANELIEVSFEDIVLNMQPDIAFRPMMLTDRVKELEGKRIRISGFMLADAQTRGIKQFVLLKNTECKFGPGGQADHLVNVILNEGLTTSFRREAVHVAGVLKINPYTGPDGNTWSIFDLACERVENYRPKR